MLSFFRITLWSEMTECNSNEQTKAPILLFPHTRPRLLPTSVGVLGTRERTRAGYRSISRILSVNFQAAKILHSMLTSVDPSNSTEILYAHLQQTNQFHSRVGWETLRRWSDRGKMGMEKVALLPLQPFRYLFLSHTHPPGVTQQPVCPYCETRTVHGSGNKKSIKIWSLPSKLLKLCLYFVFAQRLA